MKHTGRLPSVLLALCLALGVAAWSAQGARAEAPGVDYVGADGRTYNTGNDAPTRITGSETSGLPAGWYVVDQDVTRTGSRLEFNGDVHLILADGCTLTAPGIHCLGSLTIYGQAGGTGTIISSCPNNHGVNANGSLTIHGGAITATNSKDAKGICCVNFCMTGGQVTVQGDTGGISGTGTAEIGFRTAKDFLRLEPQAGAVFSDDFASVKIAKGQVMTDGKKFYTGGLGLDSEQIAALNGKTLQLVEKQCEAQIGDTKYAAVQTALNAAAEGQTVTLLLDVTTAATLTVPAGADVTLDLNDHCVRYTGEGASPVITLDGGALTLDDRAPKKTARFVTLDEETGRATYVDVAESDEAGDGCLAVTGGLIAGGTGHYDGNAVSGGGVYVDEGSTFTMNGGTICGNAVNFGGGVYSNEGTFNMEGGTITGNAANEGAGVFVSSGGRFAMSGGTICGNTAGEGGGVYVAGGTFTMNGGTISGNTAGDGGGVYVSSGGRFAMSGDAVISDNSASSGGGVFVYVDAIEFTMSGGVITGNNADDGGGVYCYACSITVGGSAVISGNVKGGAKGENGLYTGGTASNANLDTNTIGVIIPIIVGSPLTGGAHIGVTMPSSVAAGAFTSGLNGSRDDAAHFKSDREGELILINGDGEAVAARLSTTEQITAPGGSTLVLAIYDAAGRLTGVRSVTLDHDCIDAPPTELLEFHFDRTREPFRLMLLDGKTYAPLCEAWTD